MYMRTDLCFPLNRCPAKVLIKADMLDYYSVSGCYILKPWSYSIWEIIQGNEYYLATLHNDIHLRRHHRVVQFEDQGDGCREFILSNVRVSKSSRARKRSYRRIFPGGRLGYTSVRLQNKD